MNRFLLFVNPRPWLAALALASTAGAADAAGQASYHRHPRSGRVVFIQNEPGPALPAAAARPKPAATSHPGVFATNGYFAVMPEAVRTAHEFLAQHSAAFGLEGTAPGLRRQDAALAARLNGQAVTNLPPSSSSPPRNQGGDMSPQSKESQSKDALEAVRYEVDQLGMTHVRYRQCHRGVPVYAADATVHVDAAGRVSTAGANLAGQLDVPVQPRLTAAEAVRIAKAAWHAAIPGSPEPDQRTRLTILVPGLIEATASREAYLVWEVELSCECGRGGELHCVDAQTGERRLQLSTSQELDRRIYDCAAEPGSNLCYVDRLSGEFHNYIFGRSEGWEPTGPNPRYLPEIFTDTDKLYDFMALGLAYYQQKFNRNGANGQGGTANGITAPVTRSWGFTYSDYLSSWQTSCPGGASFSQGRLVFCHGAVAPDTFGHEYAHALPYYSIRDGSGHPVSLVYQGESGALDENQADVFGEMFERWYTGTNDWITGSRILGGPFYDLANPVALVFVPNPAIADRYHAESIYCGASDHGGVHRNSTIPSKAAYLLSRGGTFNGCTVTPLGEDKVEQIWYRVVTQYYAQAETFNGAYLKLIQVTRDLYGETDAVQVARALQAVELDQPGGCSGLPGSIPRAIDVQGW